MINIIADTHTHTLMSSHAYSTLLENVAYAKKVGMRVIANTDHGPTIAGSPQLWYFHNQKAFPEVIDGVIVLKGCEVNIIDFEGSVDLTTSEMDNLDWVVASFHSQVVEPGTVEQHTNAYLRVAENPSVDVIGHSGDGRFGYDYERCIKAFKEYDKIVEINNHSFAIRPNSDENCREIALLCKKYQVPVVVNSDAHFCTEIGHFDVAVQMLEEIDFPHDLILNADYDRLYELICKKSGRTFSKNVIPY